MLIKCIYYYMMRDAFIVYDSGVAAQGMVCYVWAVLHILWPQQTTNAHKAPNLNEFIGHFWYIRLAQWRNSLLYKIQFKVPCMLFHRKKSTWGWGINYYCIAFCKMIAQIIIIIRSTIGSDSLYNNSTPMFKYQTIISGIKSGVAKTMRGGESIKIFLVKKFLNLK